MISWLLRPSGFKKIYLEILKNIFENRDNLFRTYLISHYRKKCVLWCYQKRKKRPETPTTHDSSSTEIYFRFLRNLNKQIPSQKIPVKDSYKCKNLPQSWPNLGNRRNQKSQKQKSLKRKELLFLGQLLNVSFTEISCVASNFWQPCALSTFPTWHTHTTTTYGHVHRSVSTLLTFNGFHQF